LKKVLQTVIDTFYAEKDRWFALLPVLFGCGIGIYFALPFEPPLFLSLAILEILLILAYICRFSPNKLMLIASLGIMALGFADIQLKAVFLRAPKNLLFSSEETYIQGKIIDIGRNYRGKTRILLTDAADFDGKPIAGTYRVTLNKNRNKLKIGECIEIAAYTFPLMKPNIYGGYQFDRKAYFEGINALGYAMSDAYPKDCRNPENSVLLRFRSLIFDLRQNIIAKIGKVITDKDEASIADALIAGDQTFIGHKLINDYRDSGLAHFLSISGLHMGMLAFIMFFFISLKLRFY